MEVGILTIKTGLHVHDTARTAWGPPKQWGGIGERDNAFCVLMKDPSGSRVNERDEAQ